MSANFKQQFNAALDQLEKDAAAVGLTLTSICRTTKVSRATPDRWRKETPKTVDILASMQKVVSDKRAQMALSGGAIEAALKPSVKQPETTAQ